MEPVDGKQLHAPHPPRDRTALWRNRKAVARRVTLEGRATCRSAGDCLAACDWVFGPGAPISPAPAPPCVTPEPVGPWPGGGLMPDNTCCAAAEAPCSSGHGGGVVCCQGRMVSCRWNELTPGSPGENIVRGCAIAHEDEHHDSVTCGQCLPGQICRPNFKRGINIRREECSAYVIEIECLQRRRGECAQTPATRVACEARVDAEILFMCGQAERIMCGARPASCP